MNINIKTDDLRSKLWIIINENGLSYKKQSVIIGIGERVLSGFLNSTRIPRRQSLLLIQKYILASCENRV